MSDLLLDLSDPKELLEVQYDIDFCIRKRNKKAALDLVNADVGGAGYATLEE